ncbi:ImmA/IrrE family metallo-endopeptidase [Gordonia sp. (in: high G+C Gram-positive bacteria)]|uniref:ImmA/IrrE family metallo-endopeptidase n=1 Tax=Gordonia sp. (in: high G+C Gram-positive bacteria) TaxID=84139 RepID=UPI0039E53397
MYNPWRHAFQLGLAIEFVPNLRPRATYCAGLVQIRRGLSQRERRTALAHEIVHYQRGDEAGMECTRWHLEKRERLVHLVAARRLLTIEDLADALHDPDPAAAAWVDDYTWALRMANLDPLETAELEHRFGDDWRVA